LATPRYKPVTTSRKSSRITDIAEPAPKFQMTNEFW
jgi:hypothetical protein